MATEGHSRTSTTVTFSGPRTVELVEQPVPAPGPEQVVVKTLVSLISTGTELTGFSGDFPENSAWARYVRYPWPAGYSNVGQVVEVGANVTTPRPRDRVASRTHRSPGAGSDAATAIPVPAGISDEATA